jgi:predicted metal-binding protein
MYLDDIAQQIADQLGQDVPQVEGVDRLLRLYAVLARVKGAATTAEDVHDAWAAWMVDQDPTHDALRPFLQLDRATRREDDPFVRAVRAVASRLRR